MSLVRIGRELRGPWAVLLTATVLGIAGCILDSSPTAILGSQIVAGPAPLEVGFDVSHSSHPLGQPMQYRLDFGDGAEPLVGTEFDVVLHHTYGRSGEYTAILVVSDADGRQGIDVVTITVNGDGPPIGLEEGDTAPDFTAHTTGGGDVTLSDRRGNVVLLDFWGAWCPPCRRSMPHLDQLVQTYADQGLVAIVVSTDSAEQDAIDFLASNGFKDFVSVWEPGGKYNPIAQLYGVLGGGDVGVIRYVGHPLDLTGPMIEATF
jgi:peroxiredoxin